MKKPELKDLTLREKLGQILMLKQKDLMNKMVDGEYCPRTDAEIAEIMERTQSGSLWWSGLVNMDVVNIAEEGHVDESATMQKNAQLMKKLNSFCKIPLLVGMDCEKGAGTSFSDATITGSGYTVGACNDENMIQELSAAIAGEMKAAGANWRWGPVVDKPNRLCGVSVGRSFADDYEKIAKYSVAAMKGIQSEGMAATAKHFPGSDPYDYRDSHFVTQYMTLSKEEWLKTQATTFQAMIDAGVMSIMASHMAFPAIDDTKLNGKNLPATLSDKILIDLLRGEMGFEGVVITDAMEMGGLKTLCAFDEVIVRAINAGNDILLGLSPEACDMAYQAALDGRISMKRIDESCQRVLDFKEKLGLFEEKEEEEPDYAAIRARTQKITKEIVEQSITLLRDNNHMLPLSKEKIKRVTIFNTALNSDIDDNVTVMMKEFEKRGAVVTERRTLSGAELRELVKTEDLLIFATFIGPHQPVGMPCLFGSPARVYSYAFSEGNEKSIGVSTGYPYVHYDLMQAANTFFNIYSKAPASQIAFVQTLYGELPLNTKSPIDLEPKLRYVYC